MGSSSNLVIKAKEDSLDKYSKINQLSKNEGLKLRDN